MQFRFAAFLAFAVSSYTATAKDICFDHNTVDRLVDGMAKLIPEVVGTNGTEQASEKREITPAKVEDFLKELQKTIADATSKNKGSQRIGVIMFDVMGMVAKEIPGFGDALAKHMPDAAKEQDKEEKDDEEEEDDD